MKIADNVEMLVINAEVMGKSSIIYPVLLHDNDCMILVDTGYPGQLTQIREAIEAAGLSFTQLNKVILTHQDIDHIGSLSSILKMLPQKIEVLTHEEEKSYIQGDKRPVKLAALEKRLDYLPDEMKAFYAKLKIAFENCFVKVDKTLSDGDILSYCGGIRIIYTPGHTPGHICLYLEERRLLIAGDLLAVENGQLTKASLFAEFNPSLTLESLKKLSEYDIDTVICYHGGIYCENVNKRIAELASLVS